MRRCPHRLRPARLDPRRRDGREAAAARQLDLAARWADLHPPESIHSAAAFTVPGTDHEEPLAGEGCPLVAEFCIAELGTVLGISSTSAKKLIGHALELRHRLPRLWSQVQSGHVPGVAGTVGRGGHHPLHAFADPRGRCVRGRAGRCGRRPHRSRAARPAGRGDHQAVRPRHVGPGRRSRGRLPVSRPSPRDPARRGRPLRRAPCGSRPSSTSPTPSTSTTPCPRRQPSRRPSARPSRWTYAGPRPSVTSPAPRPPSTSLNRSR